MNPLKLLGFSFLLFFLSGCTEAGFELLLHLEAREVKNKAIEKREHCGYSDSSGNNDPATNGKYCFLFYTAALVTDHCLTIRKKEPILQEDCENLLWRLVMKPDSFFVKNPAGPLKSSDAHEDIDRFFLANKDDDSDPLVKFFDFFGRLGLERHGITLTGIAKDPVLAAGVRYSDLRDANPAIEGSRRGASKLWFIQNNLFGRATHTHERLADYEAIKNYILGIRDHNYPNGLLRDLETSKKFIDLALETVMAMPEAERNDKSHALKWTDDLIRNRCYQKYGYARLSILTRNNYTNFVSDRALACHIKIYCESDLGLTENQLDQLSTLEFFQELIHGFLLANYPGPSNAPSWWPAYPYRREQTREQHQAALDQYNRDLKSLVAASNFLWRDNNEAPANDHLCGIDSVFSGL